MFGLCSAVKDAYKEMCFYQDHRVGGHQFINTPKLSSGNHPQLKFRKSKLKLPQKFGVMLESGMEPEREFLLHSMHVQWDMLFLSSVQTDLPESEFMHLHLQEMILIDRAIIGSTARPIKPGIII